MELLELEKQMVSLNRLGWASVPLLLETTKIIIPLSMRGGVVLLVRTRKRRTSELLTSKHKSLGPVYYFYNFVLFG